MGVNRVKCKVVTTANNAYQCYTKLLLRAILVRFLAYLNLKRLFWTNWLYIGFVLGDLVPNWCVS